MDLLKQALDGWADIPGELVPIIAIMMTMSIPIVAILVNHQRKMAELIHQNHAKSLQPSAEMTAIRNEMAELRRLMHEQMIAVDDLRSAVKQSTNEVNARLGG